MYMILYPGLMNLLYQFKYFLKDNHSKYYEKNY